MSSKAGSSFVTFLMSISLAAIPLMAIFGIPTLSTVSNAVEGEDLLVSELDDFAPPASDRPQEIASDMQAAPRHQQSQAPAAFDNRRELTGSFTPAPERFGNASTSPVRPVAQVVSQSRTIGSPQAEAGTWQQAAESLDRMGLSDYRLLRGLTEGSFVFVCTMSSASHANITQRFEAESNEPVQAVHNVLRQIEQWQAGQQQLEQQLTARRVPRSQTVASGLRFE